ncbi:hypothetical protein WICMUC_000634 [Wickerhamomyces mucosus]|uniref:Oxidation resistance protein 1 n=1 Tax=Wickerhamomyces mucosus TaxID=1378264 RepID=A0A9P8TIC2_9ASCO|nr:hypothetical protein WICMUC_000634 [Wickerhamomyces mucosus]
MSETVSSFESIKKKLTKLKKSKSPSSTVSSRVMSRSNSNSLADLVIVPPLAPLIFEGYIPTTKNRLITEEIGEDIRNIIPARLQINHEWKLLYSLEQHGASLSTLYRLSRESKAKKVYDKNGYVLVVKDGTDNIFGSYTNEIFTPHELKRHYGNGECFLWKSKKLSKGDIQFKAFPYTGLNEYLIYCQYDSLSLGSSEGHNGLWLDNNLMKGVTEPCLTFGNEPLSEEGEKFNILGVELWMI